MLEFQGRIEHEFILCQIEKNAVQIWPPKQKQYHTSENNYAGVIRVKWSYEPTEMMEYRESGFSRRCL